MPFCSCLPCFKDKDTRHSAEDDLKKPIPVQKVIDHNSKGSASKTSTNGSPSNAVTFSNEKSGPNDPSNLLSAVSGGKDTKPIDTTGTNNAVSFNNDRLPVPNQTSSTESNVSALKNRQVTETNDKTVELDSTPTNSPIMAEQLKSAASSGAEKVQGAASSTTTGTQDWEAMTEDQKKQAYDALPEEKKNNMGYMEWIKSGYYHQKENWMPWIEDQYLRWFTKDNKASYATKGKAQLIQRSCF